MESVSISIVMVVHDQAELLEQNLPQFMAIADEVNAEVIVVDDMSTDSTPDVLQQMRSGYKRLYTTFLPQSVVMNPSRLRLALSIGVKAAKGDYIVISDISRPALSAGWLTGMADGEAVLVFSKPKGNMVTHVVASDLDDFRSIILKAERKSGKGHRGQWKKKRRGLYDAVSVRREHAFELVQLFDRSVGFWQLLGLRLRTWL